MFHKSTHRKGMYGDIWKCMTVRRRSLIGSASMRWVASVDFCELFNPGNFSAHRGAETGNRVRSQGRYDLGSYSTCCADTGERLRRRSYDNTGVGSTQTGSLGPSFDLKPGSSLFVSLFPKPASGFPSKASTRFFLLKTRFEKVQPILGAPPTVFSSMQNIDQKHPQVKPGKRKRKKGRDLLTFACQCYVLSFCQFFVMERRLRDCIGEFQMCILSQAMCRWGTLL